jgi:hypothetical protein
MTPPRRLLAVELDRMLVGHGEGIHDDATAALREAVTLARRRTLSWARAGLRAHRRFHPSGAVSPFGSPATRSAGSRHRRR